ncbi:uncharacterized protein [Epargyreus clarus]|uniref:uncharacterized protein n=1 Tax=Epargyreus clarus TaxID=520877 RepID=UPI003C2EBA89
MCFTMEKCCCCVTLERGTKLIAIMSLVSSLWTAAVYGAAALYLPSIPQTKQSFYLLIASAAVCQAGFCCLLVYGAFGRKPSYLWPWLVASWMSCAGLVLLSLLGVLLLALQYHEDIETSVEISTMSSIYFVYAVILYYCTAIVNSRREQMIREEEIESAEQLMRPRDIPKSLLRMPWFLFLISTAACHEVYEDSEETTPKYNITTLYPVTNKTIHSNKDTKNQTDTHPDKYKAIIEKEQDDKESDKLKIPVPNKSDKLEIPAPKNNITTWKIDSTYIQPKDSEVVVTEPKGIKHEDSKSTDYTEELSIDKPKSKTEEKEFKPSPHLGSFFDDENLKLLRFSTAEPEPYILPDKKPTLDFVSSKDLYMLNYKSPKDTYRDQIDTPYRYESTYFPQTKYWQQTLDSNPTVESPKKIPAGGLYKHSDPFKTKPGSNGDDEDFGLSFHEDGKEKENPVKKRSNPWKNLLNLVTAFLPVGLIISALTPSVITLQSTSNDPHVNRFSRRLGGGYAAVPPISERCKRRLLCEIHSDQNYIRSQTKPPGYVRKHCYKIHCEDPQALNRVLRWLLSHQPGSNLQAGPSPQPHPAPHRYRGEQYSSDALNYHHRSNDFT